MPVTLVNSGDNILEANHLFGMDSSGNHAVADGDPDARIRAIGLALSEASGGQEFRQANSGAHSVALEDGIDPTPGERSWLTQTVGQEGRVTNVRPTRRVQGTGPFTTGRDPSTDLAIVVLSIDAVDGGQA